MINRILIYLVLAAGCFGTGFHFGMVHQIGKQAKVDKTEIKKIVETNNETNTIANESEKVQIVYKDKIVTQYKTITKEVIKYVEKENANNDIIWVPSDWVGLHDDAVIAANGENEAPGTSTNSDATSETIEETGRLPGTVGVRSGKVLEIVSENYEAYANCKIQLEEFQKFYETLKASVNEE